MRRILIALAAALAVTVVPTRGRRLAAQSPARLLDDVKYLSSDALEGRMTGSPGADTAAAYLARRFAEVGLRPPAHGWFQEFVVSSDAPAAYHLAIGGLKGRNVIGILPGRDRRLGSEAVVVGAHYDHLGRGGPFALDPDSTGAIHNGADDNASGAAALIEIARVLALRAPARTVVFVAFSGEEEGLLGSAFYVQHPAVPIARTTAMVNLDMVGRLRNDRLIIYGVGSAKELPPLLDSLDRIAGFDLKTLGDGYGPSDQSSFYAAKRPVLHFFTDLHEDYHRTTDDWEKINADGLKRVADFAEAVVAALADRRRPLTFVDLPVTAHAGADSMAITPGYGAYLGTIPDMSGTPGGVRLTGVRAGSPAEQAGLRSGDIITRIGDRDIPDLEAMAEALRAHKAGDVVDIVARRGDSTTTVRATLGTRGS